MPFFRNVNELINVDAVVSAELTVKQVVHEAGRSVDHHALELKLTDGTTREICDRTAREGAPEYGLKKFNEFVALVGL